MFSYYLHAEDRKINIYIYINIFCYESFLIISDDIYALLHSNQIVIFKLCSTEDLHGKPIVCTFLVTWLLMILSICYCVYWPFANHLWRNVY